MNRSLQGAVQRLERQAKVRVTMMIEPKAISAEDAYYVMEAASSVVFIPGYGMAVAQAQHVVKELASFWRKMEPRLISRSHGRENARPHG